MMQSFAFGSCVRRTFNLIHVTQLLKTKYSNQDPVAILLGHPAHFSLPLLSSTLPTQSSHHAFSKRAAMFLILLGDPGAPAAPPSEEEEALSDFFLPGVAPLLTTPL